MGDTLRDIPEFIERELGESLEARNSAIGNKRNHQLLPGLSFKRETNGPFSIKMMILPNSRILFFGHCA